MTAPASRRLGRTGLEVSTVGLGLAALGRPAYINLDRQAQLGSEREVEALRRRTHEVLDAAVAAGIRYLDAARSYGLAEDFLGSWLDDRPARPDLVVGSKWGYRYTGGWRMDADEHEVKDLSADHLRRQLAETRERLGDALRLYQIHSATLESGVLEDADVLGELAALRDDGVAIGLSVSGAGQAGTVARAVETGAFDTVQATWNLHERSAGPALAAAHEAGLGVIVKEPVANGRLTGRHAPDALVQAAAQRDATPDAVAIAVVLAQPWVDVVLSGATSVAMLHANLAALDVPVDRALLDALAGLQEPADAYWATRSALPWQ